VAVVAMTGVLLSSHWYRVASLRPRLRPHLKLARHRYRGERWFVLRDPVSGRSHRFTPGARLILNGMDGSFSVAELWAAAQRQLGESAPTQDELIALLGQLHAADLMQCDVSPDAAELFERSQQQGRAKARQAFGNPMSLKFSLVDPDRWLVRLAPLLKPLWNRWGLLLWLALVLPAAVAALVHRTDLSENLADRVLSGHNLLLLGLLFPLIKVLHELGHGIAVRLGGGEVHDMGLMMLVFMPVPYVDASAASSFRSKWERAVVGAAGMMVELLLAAFAMALWLLVEPGLVRSLAFNVMLVAGVSTLVFNGNPLLRYDGYFILADLTETPNLAARATRCWGYFFERWCFGVERAEAPAATRGERLWLMSYAVAALAYRLLVGVAIVLFVAGEYFVIGVVLAIWAAITMIFLPLGKTLSKLLRSPRLAPVRGRTLAMASGGGVLLFVLLGLVPVPLRTQTEGVLWLPEQALLRAAGPGFQSRYLVEPGSVVKAGEPLVESINPLLSAQREVAAARVAELQAQVDAQRVSDHAEAEITRRQLAREQSALAALDDKLAGLISLSPGAGRFIVPRAADQAGRFHRKGDMLGYVVDPLQPQVRVVVPQGEVGLVSGATREVSLRRASQMDQVIPGRLLRELPGGTAELPSRALAVGGGGTVAVDPRDEKGLRSLQRSFQIDLAVPSDGLSLYGGRVFVRFEHPPEPLLAQAWRSVRQLFLSRFHV
jgi:putative peptide zinc metalloprotease protein